MDENKHLKIRCGGEIYIELNDLHFFQNKLKTIDKTNFDKLKKSIIQDGLPLGFHVWFDEKKQQWEIIDGHHRYLVLKDLESDNWFIPPIPCNKVIARNRKEAAKIVLISNSRYAKINQESLAEFMIDFELQVPDLELLDFADIYLNNFKIDDELNKENEGLCDPDEVPDHVDPKAKLGDIYKLGEHRLMCGDSTSIDAVERLMGGNKADMVFTSPPYNGDTHLDYGGGNNKKLYENNFDSKTSEEYIEFCHEIMRICFSICNGFIFWNVNYNGKSRYEYIESIFPFIKSLHETIVWKKTGMPLPSGLTRNFEFIFCFRNGERKHLGKTNQTNFNFWDISNINSQDKNNHRACFPIELPVKGIELASEQEQSVYDPFGGSGTTLIACEKTKRKCFMMELDPHYIDVIIARWEKYTGKKAELINNA